MARIDDLVALRSILDLRRTARGLGAAHANVAIRACERTLRDAVGPSVAKRVAARVLEISPSMLDRLVAEGAVTTVVSPGVLRARVELRSLIDMAEALEREHVRGPERGAVVRAARRLRPPDARPVAVWEEVARLPRCNVPRDELRAQFLATTPSERLEEGIFHAEQMSHVWAAPRVAT